MTPYLKKTCPAILLALALATPAYPWAREGHMAIAAVAEQNLSADARAHVIKILGNDDLAAISVYMDELRSAVMHTGTLGFDPEAQEFIKDFPKNSRWHYVDLPLGTTAYDPDGPFAKPDDIVHTIGQAVGVLEGQGDPRISKVMALRMVVHFVGDVHQPLHCTSGYYQIAADGTVKLVTDPEEAKGLPDDGGGNDLILGPGFLNEVHNYWDAVLVTKITHSNVTADLVKVLQAKIAADGAGWKSTGDYHRWAEGWAEESVVAARTAYQGIEFGVSTKDPKTGYLKIPVKLDAGYDEACVPVAEQRLAQAAYHLAEILNAIHWAD